MVTRSLAYVKAHARCSAYSSSRPSSTGVERRTVGSLKNSSGVGEERSEAGSERKEDVETILLGRVGPGSGVVDPEFVGDGEGVPPGRRAARRESPSEGWRAADMFGMKYDVSSVTVKDCRKRCCGTQSLTVGGHRGLEAGEGQETVRGNGQAPARKMVKRRTVE